MLQNILFIDTAQSDLLVYNFWFHTFTALHKGRGF